MTPVLEDAVEKYPPPPPESSKERTGRLAALFVMPFLIVTMMYATYVGTMHDPSPRDLPVAVLGSGAAAESLADELERSAEGTLAVSTVADLAHAQDLIAEGEIVGALAPPSSGDVALIYSAAAAGASQATLVDQSLVPFAIGQGWSTEVRDLAPLPEGDSSGTAVLFAAMGMMLAGYVPLSALLLATPNLTRVRRFLPLSVGWAVLCSTIIWLLVGPVVGAVEGHFLEVLGIGTLAIMAVHLTQLLFTKLMGPFAVLLGMLLWVVFGVPASGLAMSIHTMPGFFQWLHDVLPLPAAGQALRSVIYFDGAGVTRHIIVLAAWLVGALALSLLKERRSGVMIVGGPAYTEPDAPLPGLAGGPVASYRRRIVAVILFPLSIMVTVVTMMGLSMHQPDVRDMPIAVVGQGADQFIAGVEPDLGEFLALESMTDEDEARERIVAQEIVAAYVLPDSADGSATLITASGAGASQRSVVLQMFEPIAAQSGTELVVDDLAPLTENDSGGSNSMYLGMSWILAGFLFFAVLRGGAPDLTRTRQLLPLVAGWSVGISIWLWFLFDVIIGAVNGHAFEMIGFGIITVFSAAWVTALFTRVLGLAALVPGMVLVLLAGIPASGGGLSLYMVPAFFRPLAEILPLPAAVDIARSMTYLDSVGVGHDLLVLAIWGAVALALNHVAVDPWLNRAAAKPHAPLGPRHASAPASTEDTSQVDEDPRDSPVATSSSS